MREVGEPEPAAEQRRVGELERVPGFYELGRRATTNRAAGSEYPGGGDDSSARPSSPRMRSTRSWAAPSVLGPQRGIEAVGGQVGCDVGVG